MTLLHQAAQKAVEAMKDATRGYDAMNWNRSKLDAAIAAIESALQQPEPVAKPSRIGEDGWRKLAESQAALLALQQQEVPREPVDMVLYCPDCGAQHIDAPELGGIDLDSPGGLWLNPPHRSHKCHGCDCIWRPADVATNGVAELKTQGKADTWVVRPGHMSGAFPVSDLDAASPSTTQQQEAGNGLASFRKAQHWPSASMKPTSGSRPASATSRGPTPVHSICNRPMVASWSPCVRNCSLPLPQPRRTPRRMTLVAGRRAAMPNGKQVWIDYTNYRGERGWRRIEPGLLDFTSTEFHPEPQWLMDAWDPEKMAWRTFAMKDVHAWSLTPPAGVGGNDGR